LSSALGIVRARTNFARCSLIADDDPLRQKLVFGCSGTELEQYRDIYLARSPDLPPKSRAKCRRFARQGEYRRNVDRAPITKIRPGEACPLALLARLLQKLWTGIEQRAA
jgi:hypothetical protein